MQLYVDMDGVLADFDQHHENVFGVRPDKSIDNVDWNAVRAVPDFYANIPPMKDLPALWDSIEQFQPIVLTGIPWSVEEAEGNKRGWVAKHLGVHVRVLCCKSKDKCGYAAPGDILIDDWEKYRSLWEEKGGRWITHTSAEDTIQQLLEMGIGL